tara:strand:+ start:1841 stop:2482 length:642 start_codon:yes stop_codon:yes gene_type:complete
LKLSSGSIEDGKLAVGDKVDLSVDIQVIVILKSSRFNYHREDGFRFLKYHRLQVNPVSFSNHLNILCVVIYAEETARHGQPHHYSLAESCLARGELFLHFSFLLSYFSGVTLYQSIISRALTVVFLIILNKVVGDHTHQKGSVVLPKRFRFDYQHSDALKADQIEKIEKLVNEYIEKDLQVSISVVPLDDAKKINGVRAMFGEQYPNPVRVVR